MTGARCLPYLAFAALGVAAAFAALVDLGDSREGFARFLGTWPPTALIGAIAVAGGGALFFLHAQRWGQTRPSTSGLILLAALATVFAVPPIVVDLLAPFPADLNIMPPGAFLFYPVMAFVVECLFHLLPLALLVALLGNGIRGSITPFLIVVALAEPTFQVLLSRPGDATAAVLVFVAIHLFAFNLFQLILFRRYGFAVMFGVRLVYYLNWHIVWGSFRLTLG